MASSPRKRTELPTANVIVALGPCARSGMPACIQHGKHGDAPCCCCMYVCCMTHACMLICVCVPMGIHVRYVRYARTHGHSCTLHTHARTHARTWARSETTTKYPLPTESSYATHQAPKATASFTGSGPVAASSTVAHMRHPAMAMHPKQSRSLR